jgi:hypothetical protein
VRGDAILKRVGGTSILLILLTRFEERPPEALRAFTRRDSADCRSERTRHTCAFMRL